MKVKVCGLKYFENISQIAKSKVDYIGFIFYKGSPRYIENELDFDEVRQIPKTIEKVGVFVDQSVYSILNTVAHYDLDLVQLHGSESPKECEELRSYVKVIKAFRLNESFDFSILNEYENKVDFFLFDSVGENYGGNGQSFDFNILKDHKSNTPYFLSGGIDLRSLKSIGNTDIPKPYALDINSKFELEPGLKDVRKIKLFIDQIKTYENAILS
jgi:phosphoribosylanthranilate isomerase